MARLVGTGKDPRYGKGEVFDVPKYAPVPGGHGVEQAADRELNATYKELIDTGKAKELDPKDDPARTPTQIADHLVSTGGAIPTDPVDAKLAEDIGEHQAYAMVHAGDASAKASGTLRTKAIEKELKEDRRQHSSGPGLTEEKILEENQERAKGGSGDKAPDKPSGQPESKGGSGKGGSGS